MAEQPTILLRFQRAELEQKADLTPAGRKRLGETAQPGKLIDTLTADGNHRDAVYALVLLLPHRQVVWWACLAARLLPDLESRPADLAAVAAAERWVQSHDPVDALQAGAAAEACDDGLAPHWVATAAFWAGPSIAPQGLDPVPPAPFLSGIATRSALIMLSQDPSMVGKVGFSDWLEIGIALMRGDSGGQAQLALRHKLFGR